jgi:hypothetical protein
MTRPNQVHEVEPMSAAVASEYVRTMIHRESTGPGDCERAMRKIEAKTGIGYWTLDHLRKRKAKTIDVSLFARVRAAYLDLCERQVSRLQEELKIEKAICGDDTLEDLEREAAQLVARIAAKRAELR